MELDFELDRDYVELNQLLKLSGLCDSGGAGKVNAAQAPHIFSHRHHERLDSGFIAVQPHYF